MAKAKNKDGLITYVKPSGVKVSVNPTEGSIAAAEAAGWKASGKPASKPKIDGPTSVPPRENPTPDAA